MDLVDLVMVGFEDCVVFVDLVVLLDSGIFGGFAGFGGFGGFAACGGFGGFWWFWLSWWC